MSTHGERLIMKKPELSHQEYHDVYSQLSQLESAGIDAEQALTLLAEPPTEYARRARQAKAYSRRGFDFVKAGRVAGLFSVRDVALLEAAHHGGQQATVYQHLAQSYDDKARRLRQIKSRTMIPMIILVLALFIEPLPRLFASEISALGYLTATALKILLLGGLAYAGVRLSQWMLTRDLCRVLPYFGHWCLRQQTHDFIWTLGLLLQAGVPILEAIPLAARNLRGVLARDQSKVLLQAIESGQLFTDALATLPGIEPSLLPLVRGGEHSGALDSMLLHYARLEADNLQRHHDFLTQWLPRFLYALIALWMASSILGSGISSVDTLPG